MSDGLDTKKKEDLHFLVVDDDAESRKTVVEYLQSLGYAKVSTAENGAEALHFINHNPFIDFIVSDWDMPMMNGMELLRRLRSDPAHSHIPFLMITSPGSTEFDKIVSAAENLVDAYVIKPFRINIFKEKIDGILDKPIKGTKQQVLVVDDDPLALAMITDYLIYFGFTDVKESKNGVEALQYLKKNKDKIGLVISDWDMPKMTGIELLKACKADKVLSKIPFLMVTSQNSLENMKVMQAARSQVDQYLLKPFKVDDFKLHLQKLFAKKHSKHQIQRLMDQGKRNMTRGDYDKAKACFEQILHVDANFKGFLKMKLGFIVHLFLVIQAPEMKMKNSIEANVFHANF